VKKSTESFLKTIDSSGKTPFKTVRELQNLLATITIKSFVADFEQEQHKIEGLTIQQALQKC